MKQLFKIFKITKSELFFLSFIFLSALIIRAIGIEWGLPSQNNLHSPFLADEPTILRATLLLRQGIYDTKILQNYPIFYYGAFLFFGGYYLWGRAIGLYPNLDAFEAQYWQDISPFLLAGRTFTLVLASLSIVATYFLGRKLFGRRIGAFASLFLLFSFGHIVYSKVFRLDTALPLIFIISFYLLIKLLEAPPKKLRPYVLCALGMVLVTGSKITGWSFLLPLSMVPFLTDEEFSLKRTVRLPSLDRRFIILLFILFIGYLVLIVPFLPQMFSTITSTVSRQLGGGGGYRNASSLSVYDHSIIWHIVDTLPRQLGVTIYPLVWLGLFLLPFHNKNRQQVWLMLATIIGYMVPVGYAARTTWRDMLPMLPFLTIAAAFALDWIFISFFQWSRLYKRKWQYLVMTAIFTVLLIIPVYNIYQQKALILKTDTRDLAKEWIEVNLPQNSKLAIELYGPGVQDASRTTDIRNYVTSQGWPLQPLSDTPMYKISRLDIDLQISRSNLDADRLLPYLVENEIEYVIVSSGYYARYYQGAIDNHFPELGQKGRRFYDIIETHLTPVRQFIPNQLDAPGPIIKIYAVPENLSLDMLAEPIAGSFIPFPHMTQPVSVVGYYQFAPR